MYFILFESCIPVKGYKRSIICDTQRRSYLFIPNFLFEVLTKLKNVKINEIKKSYDNKFNNEVDEYFDFLEKNEYGFLSNNCKLFPAIEHVWESPALITNAIIDIGERSNHDFEKIFKQLDELGCENIQLRSFVHLNLGTIKSILEYTFNRGFRSIEIINKYSEGLPLYEISDLCYDNHRISNFIFHSAPKTEYFHLKTNTSIYYSEEIIDSAKCCGVIAPFYFSTQLESIIEAKNHNSCLNKKISIDQHGEIKNCPSFAKSYGNFKDQDLLKVVHNREFTSIWNITKDEISICKDCEFRFICTDCRAYLKDKDSIYSKPLKCNYDPYKSKWNEKPVPV